MAYLDEQGVQTLVEYIKAGIDTMDIVTDVAANAPLSSSKTQTSVTISHNNSGVTAGSKGDASAQTPSWGGTFKALSGTVNATGHLTAFAEHNVTIPNSTATSFSAGLMSAQDKVDLGNAFMTQGSPTSAVNLNTVTTAGIYYLSGSYSHTNMPTGETYGTLLVYRSTSTSGVIIQHLATSTSKLYQRRSIDSGSIWGDWSRFASDVESTSSVTKSGLTAEFWRRNGIVEFKISGTTTAELSTNQAFFAIGTIGADFRPSEAFDTNAMLCLGTTGARYGRVQVTTAGVVNIGYSSSLSGTATNTTIANGSAVRFTGTYLAGNY